MSIEKIPQESTSSENREEKEKAEPLIRQWLNYRNEINQIKMELQKVEEQLHGMGIDPETTAEKFLADPDRIAEMYK
ncbi:MAG: hypothetical protein Q8Q89_00860 [bacterium]|nr:hypothetical protein [bacterium]